jgi:hypothetical protein
MMFPSPGDPVEAVPDLAHSKWRATPPSHRGNIVALTGFQPRSAGD